MDQLELNNIKMDRRMEDDDDVPRLPDDTFKLLQDFLEEKAKIKRLEEENVLKAIGKEAVFQEDWQLSQFWYSSKTKNELSKIVQNIIKSQDDSIALLSCPSLYNIMKTVHNRVKIFEYDKRFSAFGNDFEFYDINQAEEDSEYLLKFKNQFDIIIADPPFLSEECIRKISHIIKNFLKKDGKIIFCSGEIVEPWLVQHLQLCKTSFKPQHERNLANLFVSYANFDLDSYLTDML